MSIWHNGVLVESLQISAVGAAWLMGDGAFETVRTYSGKPFALEWHLKRLEESLLYLEIPFSGIEEIAKGVFEVVAANPAVPNGRLRITVFSDGQVLITHIPYEAKNEVATLARYPKVKSSTYSIANTKSASYAENFRAIRLAQNRGFTDALFINEREEVVESAVANILIYRDSDWVTPKLESGCLPGVTRALLIEHFGIKEEIIGEAELRETESVALISSLREIVAVEKYESILYPSFKPLHELQALFSNWIQAKIGL